MKNIIETTTTCRWCGGTYIPNGWCPKYGLKFANSTCPNGEIVVKYKVVKIRNSNPWWKFWLSHYDTERIVLNQ